MARLLDRTMEAGAHQVHWNAGSLPSGVYVYRLEAAGFPRIGQMTLVK